MTESLEHLDPPREPWETAEYTDDPPDLPDPDADTVRVVAAQDFFLPRPEELGDPETIRVTLNLSAESVYFFKEKAAELETSYQKMIRRLIDGYVANFK